jgi:coenzyme F420-dependent glucose-6-phosphate dehydrogenase
VAASGQQAAELAGRVGDGLISVSPDKSIVETFDSSGGGEKPRYGQLTVCWAADEQSAVRTAREWWASAAVPGELSQELPLPRHFEQATQLVRDEDISQAIVCGPDASKHRQKIQSFVDAGYTHVYVHQVGPDQAGFFQFYQREVLPHFA